jgi:hypothetical protein
MAIPWTALRVAGKLDHMGLVSYRYVSRKGQEYAWPQVPTGTDPLLAAAHVSVPAELPRHLGLEIRPELTGAWSDPPVEAGRLELAGIAPGLTLRYSPGPDFGAVATFNPDFSQLESDASQIDVNQRYALYYEEKRPFFLEGQDWFAHPVRNLVYTRSMNAPLAGARATVEAGPLGLAALSVLDLAPPPSVNEGGGWTAEDLDGHMALASLARARLSLGGDSYVGLLGSDRSVLDTGLYNRVAGADSVVRLDRHGTVEAAALASTTTFAVDPGDVPPNEDPVGTTGPVTAGSAKLGTLWSSETWFVHTTAQAISPGFRQENGFVTQEDIVGALTEDHVNIQPKSGALSVLTLEPLDGWAYWRFDGSVRERAVDPSAWAVFDNGAFVKLDGRVAGEEFGGAWVNYRNVELYAETSWGEVLRTGAGGIYGTAPVYDPSAPRPGRLAEGWVEIDIQPSPRLLLSLEPDLVHIAELDGTPLYLAWTARARGELFVTRRAWIRLVGDFSGEGEGPPDWRVEPVAAWEWTPGRAVYAGGAVGDEDGRYWQVFAKLGWVFEV